MQTILFSVLLTLNVFSLAVHALNNSTAPFVFNDLYSLLTQWPNTFHPNGHSLIPGYLEPFSLLYHARKDIQLPPPSPEWLAFDPEMSYAVMASKIAGPTYFLTYRTVKPARVLYFNGMSAAWGNGWLDTQYALITGKGKANGTRGTEMNWWDDYGRAQGLCEWGKVRGIDGIVRMNAGFEIIWCDFESPKIQLVSSLNITPPGTPDKQSFPFPPRNFLIQDSTAFDDEPHIPPHRPPRPPGRTPPGLPGGGGGRPRWGLELGPLTRSGNLEWTRAAARRPTSPQRHLSLSYSDMVTFYHPRFESLASGRLGKSMQNHVVWEYVSDEDVESFVDELDVVLARATTQSSGTGTGFDWQAVAIDIVDYWATRVAQIEGLLDGFNSSANATQIIETIYKLTYSPLDPYIDYGSALKSNLSVHQIFFEYISPSAVLYGAGAALGTAFERCVFSATEFLADPVIQQMVTPQERLLQTSIESVLERLCTDFGTLFAESSDIVDGSNASPDTGRTIAVWNSKVKDLKKWLDWAAWLKCEEVCAPDSVCSMPLWPISWVGGPFGRPGRDRDHDTDVDALKPSCRRLTLNEE